MQGRNDNGKNGSRRVSRFRQGGWIGYAVAAACLVWVFHDVRWPELLSQAKSMKWWPLLPAVAADTASYVIQGARWSLLLRPLGRLSVPRSVQAVYAGLFTNEVLPLRAGEILRGYLASQWSSIPPAQVFASMAVERFLDGVWLALAFGIVVLKVQLPGYFVEAEEILALILFLAASVLAALAVRIGRRGWAPRPAARLFCWLSPVAEALGSISSARTLYSAAALSGALLALQAISFWLVMPAFGLSLSFWQGAAVFLIVHLGTMMPGAPSNVGTYQFFTVLGLMLFGVDKTAASGFSIIVFVVLTLPLWGIGLVAIGRAGLDLRAAAGKAAEWRHLRGR